MGPTIRIFNPDALGTPAGQYSHVARVKAAELLFIAGQLSTDTSGAIVGADDFDAQCRQVFANIEAALTSAEAGWGQVVQFTTYLTRAEDVPNFMAFRKREFPRLFPSGMYPPNTLLIVAGLVREAFLVEVHTIAAR
jgi:enamine deaminase RidA (YjgF/YER057c/UK114 family)